MDCKITWTKKALDSFEANIEYLLEKWTEKEVEKFVILVDRKISLLKQQPLIGNVRNAQYKNLRTTIIHKRVSLIYRYKSIKKEIELILFWNTAQHPKKLYKQIKN